MDKQMYHRLALNALILSILSITGCNNLFNNPDSPTTDLLSNPDFIKTKNEIDTIVSQIDNKYSIRVSYTKSRPLFSPFKYKYKLVPKSEYANLLKYLQILQKELDKYPDGFLQQVGIKSIIICKDMSVEGFAPYQEKAVYYNYFTGNNIHAKKVIHHELYHIIDAKFNGSVNYKDLNWSKLNRNDFRYEGIRWEPINSNAEKEFHPSPGFITNYAKSAMEEDRAEVYSALFVEEISTCLNEWIREDEILKNKVNYMKDFLLQYSDKMTSDFWANLCTGKCSSLDSKVFNSYEIKDLRFSAVLSDNTTVGLIAITEGSGSFTKWWRPNGEIYDEAPFTINDTNVETADDNLKQYQFFFYTGTTQSPLHISFISSPEVRLYQTTKQPLVCSDGRIFPNIAVMTCGLDKNKEKGQIVVEIPLCEWSTKATYNPAIKVTSGTEQNIKFNKPRKVKGKLTIDVSCPISDFKKVENQIVAIDNTGKIHKPVSIQSEIHEHEQKTSLSFRELKIAQIKEFQYKVCHYTLATFENISLKPGQITNMQIKIRNN